MTQSTLLTAASLVFSSLVWSTPVTATPINVLYGENINAFSLKIIGGDFDSDDTHQVTKGTIWTVTLNIVEDAGIVNDFLTIRGAAQHNRGPHGEGQNTNAFDFHFTIDADKFAQGNHDADPMTDSLEHQFPNHMDNFAARLNFDTVTNAINFDDIVGYTLTVTGSHCAPAAGPIVPTQDDGVCPLPPEPVADVPEPSTFVLFGSSFLVLLIASRIRPSDGSPSSRWEPVKERR